MIPMLLARLGAGKEVQAAGGWIQQNVIGGEGWLQNYFDPKITLSPTVGGNASLPYFASEQYNFITQIIAPSDKDIRALDDFFESFGYRVDNFVVPNISLRSTFTYVKTRDAVVYSTNKPAADQMAAMLNQGCKFWKGEIGK